MLALALSLTLAGQGDPCADLQTRIRSVYDFRPSKLDAKGQEAKAKQMDEVWELVKKQRDVLVPCLRTALAAPDADRWFQIDGSALLLEVDPTPESRATKLAHWLHADWSDLAPEPWLHAMVELGVAGLDVAEAGQRWLVGGETFYVAAHALEVDAHNGAFFLFGSMDEKLATPALARLAADPKQKGREIALDLLAAQATPEALKALRAIDLDSFPEKSRAAAAPLLGKPTLLAKASANSFVSRDKLLKAFRAFVKGDAEPLVDTQFRDGKTEDRWAERVHGVLKDEDLPLLREVRRTRMTYFTDEALYDYVTYSRILMARVWKPELVK
jgi:hypothetical protein